MLTKEFEYTDFFGANRKETAYFQLSNTELLELEASKRGGFIATAMKLIQDHNEPELMLAYKELILKSYGEISEDGRRFIKGEEISKAFEQTPMYDQLFMWLLTDENALEEFMLGVLPSDSTAAVKTKLGEIQDAMKTSDNAVNAIMSVASANNV